MRTEVAGEAPPAVELPEGEIHPAQTAKVLERDQVPGRCKQSPAVRQRLLQVACRVQYVGRYGQVVAVEVEALFNGVLLDIERAVLDASPAIAEACLRFREEAGRDVGVHVTAFGARQRSAACLREMHPVLEAEHSRRLRRRQLAGTVSHHHRGPHTHARPPGSAIGTLRAEPTGRSSPAGAAWGARCSSNTMWAFVPEIPNEFTPARRGHSPRLGHSMASVVTRTGRRSQSRLGLGSLKCRCFGITPDFTTIAALMSPATPAAASRWPTLVLTEPTSSG